MDRTTMAVTDESVNPARLARSDHDRIIGECGRPSTITVTIDGRGFRHEGHAADLCHDTWIVRTGPESNINCDVTVSFDAAVRFGNVRLCGPDLVHDLVTLKLVAVEALRGYRIGRWAAARIPAGMSRSLLKFVWRPLPMALYAAAAFDAMGASPSFCLCNTASASRSFGNCL